MSKMENKNIEATGVGMSAGVIFGLPFESVMIKIIFAIVGSVFGFIAPKILQYFYNKYIAKREFKRTVDHQWEKLVNNLNKMNFHPHSNHSPDELNESNFSKFRKELAKCFFFYKEGHLSLWHLDTEKYMYQVYYDNFRHRIEIKLSSRNNNPTTLYVGEYSYAVFEFEFNNERRKEEINGFKRKPIKKISKIFRKKYIEV